MTTCREHQSWQWRRTGVNFWSPSQSRHLFVLPADVGGGINNHNKPLSDNFTDILTLLKNSFYNCRMLGSGLLAWVWLLCEGEREVRVYLVTIGGMREGAIIILITSPALTIIHYDGLKRGTLWNIYWQGHSYEWDWDICCSFPSSQQEIKRTRLLRY